MLTNLVVTSGRHNSALQLCKVWDLIGHRREGGRLHISNKAEFSPLGDQLLPITSGGRGGRVFTPEYSINTRFTPPLVLLVLDFI